MAENPIGWQEIESFLRLTGEHLDPWEVDAVVKMDAAHREALSAEREANREKQNG